MIHEIGFARLVTLLAMVALNVGAAAIILIGAGRLSTSRKPDPPAQAENGMDERVLNRIVLCAAVCVTSSIATGLIATWLFIALSRLKG